MKRVIQIATAGVALATLIAFAHAQIPGEEVEPNPGYDGRYAFARVRYAEDPDEPCRCQVRDSKGAFGWMHDYPHGDLHIMKILTNLTTLHARTDSSAVVRLDSPELMRYPMIYLTEPACWHPSAAEVTGLRNYLLKGGFLIVDDFRICVGGFENCQESARQFEAVMHEVFPKAVIQTVDPSDPLLNGFFKIDTLQLQRNLQRPFTDDPPTEIRGIYENNDPKRRLMVAANYNTAIHRFWDWQDQGTVPADSKNEAYKMGVNTLLYGFTH
jgi:hypothetical protein